MDLIAKIKERIALLDKVIADRETAPKPIQGGNSDPDNVTDQDAAAAPSESI